MTTTGPIVSAAALAAAVALLASGCAPGGARGVDAGGAHPSPTDTGIVQDGDMTPMSQTGGDKPITMDQMAHAKPMDETKRAMLPGHMGRGDDRAKASKIDHGRPGKVAPVRPVGGRPGNGSPVGPTPGSPAPGSPAPRAPAGSPATGGVGSSAAAAANAKVKKKRLPVLGSPRIGRIFGQTDHNWTWYCSASVVPSHGKNIIVTAGHCLWDEHDGHLLSKDWTFVPGYSTSKDGVPRTPYGIYTVSHWWAYQAWIKKQNWRYDFAFMRLRPAEEGTGSGNVQDNVGAMGLEWDQTPKRTYSSVGYDAEHKYGWDDGGYPFYRKGTASWHKDWSQLVIFGHYLTGGASGGPWLVGYDHTTRFGYIDGVNSRSDRETDMSSAYFGSAFRKLYYKVR